MLLLFAAVAIVASFYMLLWVLCNGSIWWNLCCVGIEVLEVSARR
jgi:hypothetical protein